MGEKIILMGDNHHGEGNNSEKINEDLLNFYGFVREYASKFKIKKMAQLGDFFHQRNKLDVLTINYALQGGEKLSHFKGLFGDKPDMIPGNHDLYYRHSRDTASVSMLSPYFNVINQMDYDEATGVMFVPWITGQEEWDEVVNYANKVKPRFIFAHLELYGFRMNDNYIMEHGYSHKELKTAEKIFTAHYHHRQEKDNVIYIGSPIPFNFNDANDRERGFCVLDLETGDHEFVNYDGGNKVITIDEHDFLNQNFEESNNISVRVDVSEDCESEVLEQVKEKIESYDFRNSKVSYTPRKYRELVERSNTEEITDVENIDEAVIKHIRNSEPTKGIDNELLAKQYREAMTAGDE